MDTLTKPVLAAPVATTVTQPADGPPHDDLADLRTTLSFDATASRRQAHRASVSEVLPTDTVDAGGGRYLVAAQGPRSHLLFNDGADRFLDLLVLVETVRQGGTVIAHRFLDVPLTLAFVLRSATLEVLDLAAVRSGPAPAEIVAELVLSDIARSTGVVTRMAAEATLRVNGRLAARGGGAMIAVPVDAYRRVRPSSLKHRTQPAAPFLVPLAPDRVGRTNPRNVVIAEEDRPGGGFPLLVDRSHPHFFDHPQDHVPGTLILEAMRQSAVTVGSDLLGAAPQELVVTGCTTTFQRYVELDHLATCHVTAGPPTLPRQQGLTLPLEIAVRQGDELAAKAAVRLTVAPDRGERARSR